MRVLAVLLAFAALVSHAASQSAPFYLQPLTITTANSPYANASLIGTTVNVRQETWSVTPATNNIAISQTALSQLNQINHFIIVMLNQESFDSVMGAYPKGNTLVNNPNPKPALQASGPTFNGNLQSIPTVATTGTYSTLPQDTAGSSPQTPANQANAPWQLNIPTTTTLNKDPPHGWMQVINKINGGKMDGFEWSASTSGGLPMSYWNLSGSNLFALAGNYTLFDNFFASVFGGPLLAHMYLVGGQSVVWDNGNSQPPLVLQDNFTLTYHNYNTSNGLLVIENQEGILTYPDNYIINNVHSPAFCGAPFFPLINDATTGNKTAANLPDQLIAAGVSWAYYAQDWYLEENDAATSLSSTCKSGVDKKLSANMAPLTHYARFNPPLTSSDSTKYLKDLDTNFWNDLAKDALPSVSWVQPDKRYDWGVGDVDPADSDAWLGNFTSTLFASQEWKDNDTMLIVTWSAANGMFDHVPPYAGDRFGPGLRVPTIIASPFHTGGVVNSNPYEHLSIIKMIQRRFGLPMTGGVSGANPIMAPARDQASRDLTNSFYEAGAGQGINTASSSSGGNGRNGAAAGVSVSAAVLAAVLAVMALLL